MIKYILIIVCLFFAPLAKAQNYYSGAEYGLAGGFSQYFGDLNEEYGLQTMTPAFGGFIRVHLNPYITVRLNALYTNVGYKDAFSSNAFNKARNLSFRSNVAEASVQAEFNFFHFATGDFDHRWTPYLTGGIGTFYYNPYAEVNDKTYFLRPLGTEGQNAGWDSRKYSKFSICLPIGVGFKYWVRPGMNFGFEIADRLTTTDYLDDVSSTYVGANYFPTDPLNPNPAYLLQDRSIELTPNDPLGRGGKQRGNSSTNDQYMMFLFHLSFQMTSYKCPAYINGDLLAY